MSVHEKIDDPSIKILQDDVGSNHLRLGSQAPVWVMSTVPLINDDGKPVPKPQPGAAGYGLRLNDRQVVSLSNFKGFPADAISVEFWMNSVDTCREGVVFSYATGNYEHRDNTFLIFNYNNWGVSVNEDEGKPSNHNAGFGSTDGHWHHITVTWEKESGETRLYDNGRLMWNVIRSKG